MAEGEHTTWCEKQHPTGVVCCSAPTPGPLTVWAYGADYIIDAHDVVTITRAGLEAVRDAIDGLLEATA